MRERRRLSPLFLTAAVLVLLADQATKHVVRTSLTQGQSVSVSPWLASVFRVTYVTNSGAAFGLFPNWGDLFLVIGVVVSVALVWCSFEFSDNHWLIQLALGLQLGGATGNLVDRFRFDGFVIDFIDLSFWPLRRWPVFNLADASIVVGVGLLTLLLLREEWRQERPRMPLVTAEDD